MTFSHAVRSLLGGLFFFGFALGASADDPTAEGGVLQIDTAYGTHFNAYVTGPVGSQRAVVVIHDRWGADQTFLQWADELAREGFLVLALDLYDGRLAKFGDKDWAAKVASQIDPVWCEANLRAAISYLNRMPGRKTALVGWGFGGTQALRGTLAEPHQVISTVIVHGDVSATSEELQVIRGPVMGIFANQDPDISPQRVDEFDQKMRSARSSLAVVRVDAMPGFYDPRDENYNQAEASRAWQRMVGFLNDTLH